MITLTRLLAATTLFACFTGAACGDDSGGGSGTPAAPFESQEADDQVASVLTPADQTAFCQELLTYYQSEISDADMVKVGCYFLAIAFTGGDAGQCRETAEACVADPESVSSDSDVDCDTTRLADCTATVAELEGCYTDIATKLKGLASSVSCSMSASQLAAVDEKPASCAVVEQKCPKLFADEAATNP